MKIIEEVENECALKENNLVQIPLEQVKFYWTIVRKVLLFAKTFTGNKTDAAIDKFINAANILFEG